MFLSEQIRDKHKDKLKTFKSLVSCNSYEELEKSLTELYKLLTVQGIKPVADYTLKIFLVEEGLDEFTNITSSYAQKLKNYKLKAQEIKRSNFENLTSGKLNLVIEVFPKNTLSKPFIRLISDAGNCSLCTNSLLAEKIKCADCNQVNVQIKCFRIFTVA